MVVRAEYKMQNYLLVRERQLSYVAIGLGERTLTATG